MREGVDALRFGEYQRREVMTPRYFIFSYGMRFRLANNEAHFFLIGISRATLKPIYES